MKRLLNKKLSKKKKDIFEYVLQGHHTSLDLLEDFGISLLCTCISTRSEWLGLHLSFLYEQKPAPKPKHKEKGSTSHLWWCNTKLEGHADPLCPQGAYNNSANVSTSIDILQIWYYFYGCVLHIYKCIPIKTGIHKKYTLPLIHIYLLHSYSRYFFKKI